MSARPVVALLTDFGLENHYVGAMKGVILGLCPDAAIVDVTHGVPPQDIRTAALELVAAWRFFPPGAVFVVVVDPGVGTTRPAIAVQIGEYRFVAPDNGVLDLVLQEEPASRAVSLSDPRFARADVSLTFEGRDRFAPAGAWLARGTDLGALGQPVTLGVRLAWPVAALEGDAVVGEVVHVDRFGNLVTNIERSAFPALAGARTVTVGAHPPAAVVGTYGEAPAGSLVALFGSSGRLEVAVVQGSAAARLQAGRGAVVRVPQGA